MVQVNFRIDYGIPNEKIIQFFKDIGYKYRRKAKKSIKKGKEYISAFEFTKKEGDRRYHIFLEFGEKDSGTEHYPQAKLYAHYELVKEKRGREIHISIDDMKKEMNEMYRIHRKLKEFHYGHMEHKDRFCAHGTLRIETKAKLLEIISRDYPEHYDIIKYKRLKDGIQHVFVIIEQNNYLHLICVCAYIEGKEHVLNKLEADSELLRILNEIKNSQNPEVLQKIKQIGSKIGEFKVKRNEEVKRRDARNQLTGDIINKIKAIELKINSNGEFSSELNLSRDKLKLEKKLIKNKKTANKHHAVFIELSKQIKELEKENAKLTKLLYK